MAEPPSPAEALNMACFQLSREVETLTYSVEGAAPLARALLRVVGRVLIDTAVPGAQPEVWDNTEVMALQWIQDAIRPLGYEVRPIAGGGRPDVPEPGGEWV